MFHLAFLGSAALIAGGGLWAYKKRLKSLSGPDLSIYDQDRAIDFPVNPNAEGLADLNQYLIDKFITPSKSKENRKAKITDKRKFFEAGGLARTDPDTEYREDVAVIGNVTVHGAWTLVKGYDPDKRVLYLHGGGGTVGSDISHRPLTTNLAKRTKAAIFVPNYRLMPENSRKASVDDCRVAYEWIVANGPDGPAPTRKLAVAGDSAGGNLSLMVSNWVRGTDLKKPEAVYVLSPAVDSTASSPSIKGNFETDLMLQPLIGPLLKLPRLLLLMGMKKMTGYKPTDPDISPIHNDLSNLPPTLIQVSASEMLYDDAVRYASKMDTAGSPVILQSWDHVPHVFQMFDNYIQAATDALDEAGQFLNTHLS